MAIEAIVREDGTLVAKVPDRFKGKKVHISIREAKLTALAQWDGMRSRRSSMQLTRWIFRAVPMQRY